MNKTIFKTISTIGIIFFAVTLFYGCGKKESTENQNDKQQTTQTKEQDMQKSDNKNAEHIMVNLPSMQCNICKKNIEKAVNKVPGTIDVKVDKNEKVAHINYDKSKTDLSKIENAITMAGYDANDKKADPSAYQNLDDCCKLPKDQKENSKH
ncbi:MAG: heavy-metal-associated domain-containing protein [Ignavibacteria bacterium]|nr:heavy-metal-associated domain-containing protein [Ignavibacteria bacterium]